MLLVGRPWKMVAHQYCVSGSLGEEREARESLWIRLPWLPGMRRPCYYCCETFRGEWILSPWLVENNRWGLRELWPSCHIQAQITPFAASQAQPESLPQGPTSCCQYPYIIPSQSYVKYTYSYEIYMNIIFPVKLRSDFTHRWLKHTIITRVLCPLPSSHLENNLWLYK